MKTLFSSVFFPHGLLNADTSWSCGGTVGGCWALCLMYLPPPATGYYASCDFTCVCQSHSSFPFQCWGFPRLEKKKKKSFTLACLEYVLFVGCRRRDPKCTGLGPSAVVGIRLEVLTVVLSAGTRWQQKVSPELIGVSVFLSSSRPGSIGALWWDPVQRLLFSGASDHSIIMWDIGGRKGRTLLLQGHQ